MKVSYNTLKNLVSFDLNPEHLGVLLTNTGLEVEGIERIDAVKGGFEGLVVGYVESCTKHPDADKLNLTKVNIGGNELLDIVCGAPNVAAGQKVIVATVGTTLYPSTGEPFSIKKSKIRGAVSDGMLCAEDEIGMGASHDGLLLLDTDLANGTPIAQYFNVEPDYQIEIGLTPNRADAASHMGVARDIKAVLNLPLQLPDISKFELGKVNSTIDLSIEDKEACQRFCGLEIRGIKIQDSPKWLKSFLNVIGVNSINNIVDITNYICHYLGQPMHVFDADEIRGNKIIVKTPPKGTKITTLDGNDRVLTGQELAICNAFEPMAIAGVFGGKQSGVKNETRNIFLEVAYFNPGRIRKSSNIHGLKTDASFRYERGTDPNMPPFAIKLAALMIQELAGGEICNKLFDLYPEKINDFEFTVQLKNIDRLIGKQLGETKILEILNSLDIKTSEVKNGSFTVSVPPYRVDVTREADIIEEILRIYGFDNIELSENLNSDFIASFPVKDIDNLVFKLTDVLTGIGFSEIQNLSIVKPADNQWFGNEENTISLLNPLSDELSQMRKSLLFSSLNSVLYNINRRNKNLRFFEFGRTYTKSNIDDVFKYKEHKTLSISITGNIAEESWAVKNQKIAFQHLNQVVSEVLKLMKIKKYEVTDAANDIFQFGLQYIVNQKTLVSFGLLNEKIRKHADIKQEVYYAEFDWDLLIKNYSSAFKYSEISKYPSVRRDLSLVIDKKIIYAEIEKLAYSNEKKLLKSVNLFDVYEGDKLESGKKSYSVSFELQDDEKTLNDKQIEKSMERLMQVFEQDLGANIRK